MQCSRSTWPKSTSTPPKVAPKEEAAPTEAKAYKVRIASLSRPDKFDKSKVASFGEIKMLKQGKWTWVMLDGFDTLEEARAVRLKLRAAGYKDGRVILDKDGVFKEVD